MTATWARWRPPNTNPSYQQDWVVAIPAGQPTQPGGGVTVTSKAGKVKRVYVHANPIGERMINGTVHTLHKVDDDPFGTNGNDPWEWGAEGDCMPDIGDR